jgi:WD40 repeat protein
MPFITYEQFLATFVFDIEDDFQVDGVTASWAPGHPKQWGDEDFSIQIPMDETKEDNPRFREYIATAISSDTKLLAASRGTTIYIFDVETRTIQQELIGHIEPPQQLFFRPNKEEENSAVPQEQGYTLVSSTRGTSKPHSLIFWDLNHAGKLLVESERLEVDFLAEKALKSIKNDLTDSKYEWTDEDVRTSRILKDITDSLRKADKEHQLKHSSILEGQIANFGTVPFSRDGQRLLILVHNESTQGGMRPPDELPQAIVYDVDTLAPQFTLKGHTDAIMWTGFSKNLQHIATVSWDGTMKVWNGTSGELRWTSEQSGGQNWCAAFSPDSEHVVMSATGSGIVSVFIIATGEKIATFPRSMNDWCRELAWNPDGRTILLGAGESAYFWNPFDGNISSYSYKVDDKMLGSFVRVTDVAWLDGGQKAAIKCSDGTLEVWDVTKNIKWRFMRPYGKIVSWSGYTPLKLSEKDMLLSTDGDNDVRFWKLE